MFELDRLAVEIMQSQEMSAARVAMEDRYLADPNARSPLARSRISDAVSNYAFASALAAVADPYRPCPQWSNAWQRGSRSLQVPSGRAATDNPDNVYRAIPVAPGCSYRIDGKFDDNPPTATTFSLLNGHSRETSKLRTLGILTDADLKVAKDGRFAITIGPGPGDGRTNHIRSPEEARVLYVRETFGDWVTQRPSAMSVSRIDTLPSLPPATRETLVARAVDILQTGAPQWALKFQHDSYEKLPFNELQPIISSAERLGGLVTQSSSHGRFALAEDEALVVQVDPFDADYVGFQLADVWMVSADYVDRLGSLNNTQAIRGVDGLYTYVIARVDPGVHNWLDATGLDTGGTTIRYQGLKKAGVDRSRAVTAKLVKIADLSSVLPADTRWLGAAERQHQLSERRASYRQREIALLS